MIGKIIKYFKEKSYKLELDEFVSRIVADIEFEFKTITGEVFKTKEIIGIGKLDDGIDSAKRLILLESFVSDGNVTYKTDKIVSVNAEVKRYGVIKKEYKNKKDKGIVSYWDFMWRFEEEVVEFREFDESMIEAFNKMFGVNK